MASAPRKTPEKERPDGLFIDWIVLTASLIGLAIVIAASVQAGTDGLVANLGSYITG